MLAKKDALEILKSYNINSGKYERGYVRSADFHGTDSDFVCNIPEIHAFRLYKGVYEIKSYKEERQDEIVYDDSAAVRGL